MPALASRTEAFRREQFRSLTHLIPILYGVILSVVLALVINYYRTAPAWLAFYAPAAMCFIVIWRTFYWFGARKLVDRLTAAQHERAVQSVTYLGPMLAFCFTIIGLLLMRYGDAAQQSLAVILIWILAIAAGFCLHVVLAGAIGVVLAAAVPLVIAFAFSAQPVFVRLVPAIAAVTALILYVLVEIYLDFAKIVNATHDAQTHAARAAHAATHDPQTDLPNRIQLGADLNQAIARLKEESGQPFALHVVNLDRFKEINDAYGHQAGDELLVKTGQQLLKACPPGTAVARLGGDEFAVLQRSATRENAAALAGRLVESMRPPAYLSVGRQFVGCSVGVFFVDDASLSAAECLRRAGLALDRAKDSGRNRYVLFEPAMDATVRVRQQLRGELHEALAREELSLEYQPLFGAGAIVGVEAFARWNQAARGPIAPSVFIPIAEQGGLMDALGTFVLRRALEDSNDLKGLTVAINLSAAQLLEANFVDTLRDLVAASNADPRRIELEITERVAVAEGPHIAGMLARLRDAGFRIVLDDSGSLVANLGLLPRLALSKVKLDRRIALPAGGDDDAVVRAVVRAARAQGLEVAAKYVETEEQEQRLLAAGCTQIQGHRYARPMSLASLLAAMQVAGIGNPPAT